MPCRSSAAARRGSSCGGNDAERAARAGSTFQAATLWVNWRSCRHSFNSSGRAMTSSVQPAHAWIEPGEQERAERAKTAANDHRQRRADELGQRPNHQVAQRLKAKGQTVNAE